MTAGSFGGFTAVGFIPGQNRSYADPAAFIFSLTNMLGRPEKLRSRGLGKDIRYDPVDLVRFGRDLRICDQANTRANSETATGQSYVASASAGPHPMARGAQYGFFLAELICWAT